MHHISRSLLQDIENGEEAREPQRLDSGTLSVWVGGGARDIHIPAQYQVGILLHMETVILELPCWEFGRLRECWNSVGPPINMDMCT